MSISSRKKIIPFSALSPAIEAVAEESTDKPKKKRPKRRCVRIDDGLNPETGKRIRKPFYGKTLTEAKQKRDAYLDAKKKGSTLTIRNQTVEAWVTTWQENYIGNISLSVTE